VRSAARTISLSTLEESVAQPDRKVHSESATVLTHTLPYAVPSTPLARQDLLVV
jgi:hypothetical protein